MHKNNPKVDQYLLEGCGRCELGGTPKCKVMRWQEELEALRTIALNNNLVEEVKWGVPCYTLNNKNVVLLHGFKEYVAIMFMKGALMKDPKKILHQQTENVQSGRQIRFENSNDILKLEKVIDSYIKEAIQIEKSGVKIPSKKTEDYAVPNELTEIMHKNAAFKKAFYALTPGRQRGYLLFFAAAKQSVTRTTRIEKYMDKIFSGKGLND